MKNLIALIIMMFSINSFANQATEEQCSVFKGFLTCTQKMCELDNSGRGGTDFWLRTVTMQERTAVNFGESVQFLVDVLDQKMGPELPTRMRRKLLNAADSLISLDRAHNGDADYYLRVSNRLQTELQRENNDIQDIYREYCL